MGWLSLFFCEVVFVVLEKPAREQLLEVVGHDALIWLRGQHAYVLVVERS